VLVVYRDAKAIAHHSCRHPRSKQKLVTSFCGLPFYRPGKRLLIASANFVRPSCLQSITSNSVSASRASLDSLLRLVKPMILIPGSVRRNSDAACTPFSLGKLRPMMTKSGGHSLALSIAATPSSASQTASQIRLINLQMASRTATWSSTTRIHI